MVKKRPWSSCLQSPHGWPAGEAGGLHDAAVHDAVGEQVVVVLLLDTPAARNFQDRSTGTRAARNMPPVISTTVMLSATTARAVNNAVCPRPSVQCPAPPLAWPLVRSAGTLGTSSGRAERRTGSQKNCHRNCHRTA